MCAQRSPWSESSARATLGDGEDLPPPPHPLWGCKGSIPGTPATGCASGVWGLDGVSRAVTDGRKGGWEGTAGGCKRRAEAVGRADRHMSLARDCNHPKRGSKAGRRYCVCGTSLDKSK